MKNPSIEAKVGASSLAVFVVNGVFAFAAHYHWWPPAPPDLTLVVATVATLVAGYLAPHTSRLRPLTPSNLTIDELAGLAHAIGAEVVMGTHPTTGTALPVVTAKTPPDLDVTQGYSAPPAQPSAGTTP